MPHLNKKTTSEKGKCGSNKKLVLERTMNGLGKYLEKTVKIKVELPHMNKKPLARNRIFVKTPFSQSTLKLEQKNFTPKNFFAPLPVSA